MKFEASGSETLLFRVLLADTRTIPWIEGTRISHDKSDLLEKLVAGTAGDACISRAFVLYSRCQWTRSQWLGGSLMTNMFMMKAKRGIFGSYEGGGTCCYVLGDLLRFPQVRCFSVPISISTWYCLLHFR